jgi:hypothetical protein
MYRLRTADKGKPLIISDEVIKDYSVCDVDTLHKKNLLSLSRTLHDSGAAAGSTRRSTTWWS